MIVIIVEKWANGDEAHRFGGIACDVEGCDVLSEPFNTSTAEQRQNLFDAGWFISPGQHRCPKHFNDETPTRGPQYREVDLVTKRI